MSYIYSLDLQYFAEDSPTGQKTEKPTGRQLQKAREKGQVARSIDLSSAIILIAGLGSLYFALDFMNSEIQKFMIYMIRECTVPLTDGRLEQLTVITMLTVLKVIAPVLTAIIIAALGVNLYQTQGLLITTEQFKLKPDKFNPVKNLKKKFFSKETLMETLKSIFKIFVIGFFPYRIIKNSLKAFLVMPRMPMEPINAFIVDTVSRMVFQVCLILLILAIIDFVYQKWEHEKQLMMSKYDIKQERKQMEGDPLVKQEQRKRSRRAMVKAMLQDTENADVVLTNPTHLAVALCYDQNHPKYTAPYVVARGAGEIARRIKRIARENGVPVLENKFLARAIYFSCEIGEEIPSELFDRIAEILAFIYNGRKGRAA